ncbi:MAG: histidine kinase [Niastella sp.]|nr:histidine kinase [Niastella sp.]
MTNQTPIIATTAAIREGKVRWRTHELVFVTLFAVIRIGAYVWDMFRLDEQQIQSYAKLYSNPDPDLPFNYLRSVLLPQINSVLLLYLCYIGINKAVIPLVKKISFRDDTAVIIRKLLLAALVLGALSWFLALGFNTATYYARPWIYNYQGFPFLAWLGYNDHPMQNLLTGFDRALWLLGILSVVTGMREVIIQYMERQSGGRAYRILVLNQFTMAAAVYCTVLAVILMFDIFSGAVFRIIYAGFIPATFLVFMINTYWIFPQRESAAKFSFRTLVQLLAATCLCTFVCFLFDGFNMPSKTFSFFMTCWGMQLVVTNPVSWLIYQQRRDRILQLRGMEAELNKSRADLQFLRSQINPHFLFNALNTLYGTALREKATDTATGIQQLGDMMRFMLHENHLDFIPMHKEIEYLQHYISLQKLRIQHSPEIFIEDVIQEELCNHQIAPMLLIPFVENAFKHGISLREPSWIRISLVCGEKQLKFSVHNSVHPRPENDPEKERSGIGLQNVIGRLKLVYPGRHTIHINHSAQEFTVELSILF